MLGLFFVVNIVQSHLVIMRSGTNHVLPTNGKATTKSGLGIKDFGKQISVQTSTSEGFQNLSDTV
ncbi:MAG: hypothetical protein CM15mP126_2740 [Gammaproteobacteria bacterium]|nr:MAG: hypothetical protein CM15mP126_2740 [Gammaproteobacteria bacterium]